MIPGWQSQKSVGNGLHPCAPAKRQSECAPKEVRFCQKEVGSPLRDSQSVQSQTFGDLSLVSDEQILPFSFFANRFCQSLFGKRNFLFFQSKRILAVGGHRRFLGDVVWVDCNMETEWFDKLPVTAWIMST